MKCNCRASAVGIATGYMLDDRGGQDFAFFLIVKTGSGTHQASYAMGNGAPFLGAKRPNRIADLSPSTKAELKKSRIYIFTPADVFRV
jgi:hypothetical protein